MPETRRTQELGKWASLSFLWQSVRMRKWLLSLSGWGAVWTRRWIGPQCSLLDQRADVMSSGLELGYLALWFPDFHFNLVIQMA